MITIFISCREISWTYFRSLPRIKISLGARKAHFMMWIAFGNAPSRQFLWLVMADVWRVRIHASKSINFHEASHVVGKHVRIQLEGSERVKTAVLCNLSNNQFILMIFFSSRGNRLINCGYIHCTHMSLSLPSPSRQAAYTTSRRNRTEK